MTEPLNLEAISVPDEEQYRLESLRNARSLENAAKDNLEVYEPGDSIITLDFDDIGSFIDFEDNRLPMFQRFFPVTNTVITSSKSGNKHVYLTLESPLTPAERIAAQAFLGSDYKRELLNLARLRNFPEEPCMLMFEKQDSAVAQKVPSLRRLA